MNKNAIAAVVTGILALAPAAQADPVKLKLAMFSADT
jgi:hypothetical protein